MVHERFPFSNFEEFDEPMKYQGMEFRTVENFYQAMKTENVIERARISKMTPGRAKKAGRALKIREDWEQIKDRVMMYALEHKFQHTTEWGQKLIHCQDEEIVEYNLWHDNHWGRCSCALILHPPYGNRGCKGGQNKLGKMLMNLRQRLREELL